MPVTLVLFRQENLYLIHEITRGGEDSRKMDKQTDRQMGGWQMTETCEILDRRTEIRRKGRKKGEK